MRDDRWTVILVVLILFSMVFLAAVAPPGSLGARVISRVTYEDIHNFEIYDDLGNQIYKFSSLKSNTDYVATVTVDEQTVKVTVPSIECSCDEIKEFKNGKKTANTNESN